LITRSGSFATSVKNEKISESGSIQAKPPAQKTKFIVILEHIMAVVCGSLGKSSKNVDCPIKFMRNRAERQPGMRRVWQASAFVENNTPPSRLYP
jgi:hypothetical protein